MDGVVSKLNVGRIAERIVANELEFRGYRVSDLNRDGLSANADLLASKGRVIRQIQVKGASQKAVEGWWISYGYCTEGIIYGSDKMFNRSESFYLADVVVLVAVRSPTEYRCIVLPTDVAEKAAQINIDRGYRTLTRAGETKKPGKVWALLQPAKFEHQRDAKARKLLAKERAILEAHMDWHILE